MTMTKIHIGFPTPAAAGKVAHAMIMADFGNMTDGIIAVKKDHRSGNFDVVQFPKNIPAPDTSCVSCGMDHSGGCFR